MENGLSIFERLAAEIDITQEAFPGQTIVEILNDHRLLIENHLGVAAYNCEKIVVKTKFGCICVCGKCLELIHMTKEKLVIKGRISGIELKRK